MVAVFDKRRRVRRVGGAGLGDHHVEPVAVVGDAAAHVGLQHGSHVGVGEIRARAGVGDRDRRAGQLAVAYPVLGELQVVDRSDKVGNSIGHVGLESLVGVPAVAPEHQLDQGVLQHGAGCLPVVVIAERHRDARVEEDRGGGAVLQGVEARAGRRATAGDGDGATADQVSKRADHDILRVLGQPRLATGGHLIEQN